MLTSLTFAAYLPGDHHLDAPTADPSGGLLSNSIIDIKLQNDGLWFGTGRGLTLLHLNDFSWTVIKESNGIGHGGVSALTVTDTVIWIATAYTENIDGSFFPAGGGVGYSRDDGITWEWMDQPVDSVGVEDYSPTTTNIQNVTYDIALSATAVWITSWGGGLRRKLHDSEEWEVITPDGNPFSALDNLNHRAFSAVFADGILWVGTAAGINRSVNEGDTWVKYSHQDGEPNSISGNFVTAMAIQETVDRRLIWAATWKAQGVGESYGVSMTDDNGASWQVTLSDSTVLATDEYLVDHYGSLRVHNFGFRGDTVYAAADGGLWWHPNRGYVTEVDPWRVIEPDEIFDPTVNEQLEGADFFSVASAGDSLWIGTDGGSAVGWLDQQSGQFTWSIHRAYRPPEQPGEPDTYAYPSPFSPRRSQFTRFQFSLTDPADASFAIYDFAMGEVYQSGHFSLSGGGSGDMAGYSALKWDGRDRTGRIVANGVYFYRLKVGGDTYWGKVMVLD
ncbi:MAG: hypothetical protein P9M15_04285 [Candidatus Electryoneaceae bacterium]|nr:hypothetical protein [Candidatus Electryoneaceae bacterium]